MACFSFSAESAVAESKPFIEGQGPAQDTTEAYEIYSCPFGYSRILLDSPVLRRSIPFAKSFIGMRSVITGERSSLPALSRFCIWNHVLYMRRPWMPMTVAPLKMMDFAKSSSTGFEGVPSID